MNLVDILAERLAIVGGTGSGKSYTARGLVEKVLARPHGRVGIIDPTGVWHGLRVSADGRSPGPLRSLGASDAPRLTSIPSRLVGMEAFRRQPLVTLNATLAAGCDRLRIKPNFNPAPASGSLHDTVSCAGHSLSF